MKNFPTVFLDTEFTDLNKPELLSVGMVGAGVEFYAEVTDPLRLEASTDFVKVAVLPQFGQIPGAACEYQTLCRRLVTFFSDMADSLGDGEYIIVAYDYETDWELVKCALQDAGTTGWSSLSTSLIPVDVNNVVNQAIGEAATEQYFGTQKLAAFARHHALCDARALKIAHEAVSSAP